jgi:hypothetical protein
MKNTRLPYRFTLVTAAALAAVPVSTVLATSPAKVEASIPFGLIRDWQADREQGMWIQAYSRQWYYAQFLGRCNGLNFATAVGFDTRYQSSFDRFSSVFVPGYGRCMIQTFQPSDGPPRKKRKGDEAALTRSVSE